MRHIAFLCGAIAVSGCAGQSEFASRSADLPGIQTTIDCNPTPEMIYSKSGDLIEVKHPVLHPSCYGGVKAANALQIPSNETNYSINLNTGTSGLTEPSTSDNETESQEPSSKSKLDKLREHAASL